MAALFSCHRWSAVCRLLVMGGLLFVSRLAGAHGGERLANVTAVAAPPAGTAGPWLAALTFGAMVSDDGGKRFDWICEEALLGGTDNDSLVAAFDRDDLLYAGFGQGVATSHDGGCNWQPVPAFAAPYFVFDVATGRTQSAPKAAYVVGRARGSHQSSLWRSLDAGRSFAAVSIGPQATAGERPHSAAPVFWSAVATSEARPGRLWLAGSNNTAGQSAFLATLNDDGSGFAAWPVEGAPAASGLAKVAVSPKDANLLIVGFLDLTSNATQILLSRDGGRSSQRVALLREPLRAVAFADDGAIWLAGTTATLLGRSGTDGFLRLSSPSHNGCVAAMGQDVVLCGDASAGDRFSLARAADGGRLAVPLFSLPNLTGPYRCPADSQVARICRPLWASQAQRLGARFAAPKISRGK